MKQQQQQRQQAKMTSKFLIYGGGAILIVGFIIGLVFVLNIGQVKDMLGAPPGKDYQTTGSGNWSDQFNWGKGGNGKGKGGYPDGSDHNATLKHDINLNNNNPDVNNLDFQSGGSLNIDSGQSLTVHGTLDLSNGSITTQEASNLVLTEGATMTGITDSTYIEGPYEMSGSDSLVFQLEGANGLAKVAIHELQNSSSFSVHRVGKDANTVSQNLKLPLQFVSHEEYFEIDRMSGSGRAKVTLFWDEEGTSTDFSNVNQFSAINVAHYNSASGQWENVGQSVIQGNKNSGYVTSNAISSFSPFSFSSTSASNPLPVELMYFKVQSSGNHDAELTWATASETNNSHFEVQKSVNGENFRKIGEVTGHGTSTEKHEYSFLDERVKSKTVYYRLKQVDHDGSHEFSDIKTLAVDEFERQAALSINTISPNPFHTDFTAEFTGIGQTAHIMLRNQNGQRVYQESIEAKNGSNEFHFRDGRSLDNGIYTLIIKSGSKVEARKLVKR